MNGPIYLPSPVNLREKLWVLNESKMALAYLWTVRDILPLAGRALKHCWNYMHMANELDRVIDALRASVKEIEQELEEILLNAKQEKAPTPIWKFQAPTWSVVQRTREGKEIYFALESCDDNTEITEFDSMEDAVQFCEKRRALWMEKMK